NRMRMGLYPIVQQVLRLRFSVGLVVTAGNTIIFPAWSISTLATGLPVANSTARTARVASVLRKRHFALGILNSLIPRL
ncbi:MAG: hypothetical protein WCE36_19975, partial [Pseudolabrys sp.]